MSDETPEGPGDRRVQAFDGEPFSYRQGGGRRWWWVKFAAVLLASVSATGLILFGAVRFLDQAQRERDEVECVRSVVRDQAVGTQRMAAGVLDVAATIDARRAALRRWVDEQAGYVARLEGCGA